MIRRHRALLGLAVAAGLAAPIAQAAPIDAAYRIIRESPVGTGDERLLILGTRPGVTIRFLLASSDAPKTSIVLFAGGSGRLGLDDSGRLRGGKNNFLVSNRHRFARAGLAVATVDAPSDRQDAKGLLFGFRGSTAHARDTAALIRFLRDRFGKPVWLVGTSRGSTSVANGGIRLSDAGPGAPDGLVITAAVTVDNDKGPNLLGMRLEAIPVPVVIAHHRKDACRITPFRNVASLFTALGNVPSVTILAYRDGQSKGGACGAKSFHGFRGIKGRVVRDIARRIKRQ